VRFNPLRAMDDLRELADLRRGLAEEYDAKCQGVGRRAAPGSRPPVSVGLLDATREIDLFTVTYARAMHRIYPRWYFRPENAPATLENMASHIEWFVWGASPETSYAFRDDLADTLRAARAAYALGARARVPLGACPEEGCTGSLHVAVNGLGHVDDPERWNPIAACDGPGTHVIFVSALAKARGGDFRAIVRAWTKCAQKEEEEMQGRTRDCAPEY